MIKTISLLFAAALLALTASYAAAQSDATPTPAPSKTPTLAATTVGQPTLETHFEPLSQSDLTSITGNVQRPNGLTWFNGKLYTACTGDGTVYEIDETTGATRTVIYGVRNAQSLYVEEDARQNLTLWVPDYAANTLSKVTRNRVEPVVRDLHGPWGIAYVDDQHFMITNLLSNTLDLVSRDGDDQVLLDTLNAPMGIVHDDQTVYVVNYGSTRRSVEWYSYEALLNGQQDQTPTNHVLVSGLQNATGIQLGTDGKLYFAYSLGNRGLVGRVDPQICRENGGCANDQIEIVLYSDLATPLAGLTLTPDMRLFVHTMFVPDLYWAKIEG
jgi:hypothetical protein